MAQVSDKWQILFCVAQDAVKGWPPQHGSAGADS